MGNEPIPVLLMDNDPSRDWSLIKNVISLSVGGILLNWHIVCLTDIPPHHHDPQQPTTMDEEGEKLQTAQLFLNSQKCSKWIILFTDAAKRPTTNPHTGW